LAIETDKILTFTGMDDPEKVCNALGALRDRLGETEPLSATRPPIVPATPPRAMRGCSAEASSASRHRSGALKSMKSPGRSGPTVMSAIAHVLGMAVRRGL